MTMQLGQEIAETVCEFSTGWVDGKHSSPDGVVCLECHGTGKKYHWLWERTCPWHMRSVLDPECSCPDSSPLLNVTIEGLLRVLWDMRGYVGFWSSGLGVIITVKGEPYRGTGAPLEAIASALKQALGVKEESNVE